MSSQIFPNDCSNWCRRDHAASVECGVETFATHTMAKAAPKSFESALEELEKLVDALEGGELPLADSLAAYKRGAELLKYAQGELAQVEQQVKILERDSLKPFSPEA
jgi:exodeoxyribonuclease VII small subunit